MEELKPPGPASMKRLETPTGALQRFRSAQTDSPTTSVERGTHSSRISSRLLHSLARNTRTIMRDHASGSPEEGDLRSHLKKGTVLATRRGRLIDAWFLIFARNTRLIMRTHTWISR